jgi:hypothetical protein
MYLLISSKKPLAVEVRTVLLYLPPLFLTRDSIFDHAFKNAFQGSRGDNASPTLDNWFSQEQRYDPAWTPASFYRSAYLVPNRRDRFR